MAVAPSPRPRTRAPRRRRHLVVLPGGRAGERVPVRRRRKPSRGIPPLGWGRLTRSRPGVRLVVVSTMVVAALVFGLVLLHILLAQSSFELERLRQQVANEEKRSRLMRYEVAHQTSPARVAEGAAQAGMVAPSDQRTLIAPTERPGQEGGSP